jgi:hypothetical protein
MLTFFLLTFPLLLRLLPLVSHFFLCLFRSVQWNILPSSRCSSSSHYAACTESPQVFRNVDARDLTGHIQPSHLLPSDRDENCDMWKADWTGEFGKRKVCVCDCEFSCLVLCYHYFLCALHTCDHTPALFPFLLFSLNLTYIIFRSRYT